MQVRTILLPTDFSPHADRALDTAVAIASRAQARLELVHAFHVPPEALPYLTGPSLQAMQAAARTALDERCARTRKAGAACEAHWLEAPPASAICEQATKSRADLIVQGSHGHTGLRYALLGSVAARVARAAPCPVLTVKQRGPTAAQIRTIAVAMDFSEPARRALAAARDLGRLFGSVHVVLVHAYYVPPDLLAMLAEQGATLPGSDDPHTAEQLELLLVELQDAGISAEYVTENGHPAEVLERIAARVGADLIALGTHGRRGLSRALLGSVAEQVLRAAPGAVLTVGPPPPRN